MNYAYDTLTLDYGLMASIIVSLVWLSCAVQCMVYTITASGELKEREEALRASQEAFMRECCTD